MMKNDFCKCPYIPCKIRGNCTTCIAKSRMERTLPNCMEEITQELGAKLPLKNPDTKIYKDNDKMSIRCVELVKECLDAKPNSLLCFPAGSTIICTCELLKEMQIKGEIDFSEAEFVALDEWLEHLGLNEPGEHFDSYAKVVNLTETTMEVGQKYFSSPMKLSRGITLGVRHIFETKQVILQVSG